MTTFRSTPKTVAGWMERLAEKDAEIQRLKKLITELCDALEWWAVQRDYQPDFAQKLIQRAREATR